MNELLNYNLIDVAGYSIKLIDIIEVFVIIILSRTLVWLFSKFISRKSAKGHKLDSGREVAIKQIFMYLVYTICVLACFEALGVRITALWAGSAALLVGIGLGLQQTFMDLVSGLILLIEGTVDVGDVVLVDGIVGKVTRISIRTSKIATRDQTYIIVPNSKLIAENVINWNHESDPTRFQVKVGVSYSSDVDLVTSLLMRAATEHPEVLGTPVPVVQFVDFGESSLDFVLNFFSTNLMGIEKIKSDLRYMIRRLFVEHHVEIPFPQRDLWVKTFPREGGNPT